MVSTYRFEEIGFDNLQFRGVMDQLIFWYDLEIQLSKVHCVFNVFVSMTIYREVFMGETAKTRLVQTKNYLAIRVKLVKLLLYSDSKT